MRRGIMNLSVLSSTWCLPPAISTFIIYRLPIHALAAVRAEIDKTDIRPAKGFCEVELGFPMAIPEKDACDSLTLVFDTALM
jgi:hypothetical protein